MHRIKREWCAAVSIKLNQVSKRTEGIENLTLDSFPPKVLSEYFVPHFLSYRSRQSVSSVWGVGGNGWWVARSLFNAIAAYSVSI